MKRIAVDSSMVASIGYDKQEKILEVEFVNTGYVYEYYEVPYKEYLALLNASSKGSYMQSCIIDCYGCSKVRRKRKETRESVTLPAIDSFAGEYRIYEMPDFDAEYMHAEEPAYFRLDLNGSGEFQFGYVHGYFHGKVKHRHGETMFTFRWDGNDENDEASGDGWLVKADSDEVEGEIAFLYGDEHLFLARKTE